MTTNLLLIARAGAHVLADFALAIGIVAMFLHIGESALKVWRGE